MMITREPSLLTLFMYVSVCNCMYSMQVRRFIEKYAPHIILKYLAAFSFNMRVPRQGLQSVKTPFM